MDRRAPIRTPSWIASFEDLAGVTDPVWLEVAGKAQVVTLPAGSSVFAEGQSCRQYVLVLGGCTKVYKAFESGREMVLYRLGAGETCSVTTSVLLAGGRYPADAVTEAETTAVLIPTREFHQAFDGSKGFREFVCKAFGGRIRHLIMLLESVMVRNVDARLARWLLRQEANGTTVEASHRELAFELGTAREVVSRNLKNFEQKGWVTLSRRSIEVRDVHALRRIAEGIASS